MDGDTEKFLIQHAQIGRAPENGPQGKGYQKDIAFTLDASGEADAVAWHENKGGSFTPSNIAKALRAGASHSYQGVGVRRLTPTEAERLQGFDDGWTSGFADTVRYRMLGNAVVVPVSAWIGKRIVEGERDR